MKKRHRMSKRYSRKLFSKTANRTHRRNAHVSPMRGGIRL